MELASGKGFLVTSLHGAGQHKKLAKLLNLSY